MSRGEGQRSCHSALVVSAFFLLFQCACISLSVSLSSASVCLWFSVGNHSVLWEHHWINSKSNMNVALLLPTHSFTCPQQQQQIWVIVLNSVIRSNRTKLWMVYLPNCVNMCGSVLASIRRIYPWNLNFLLFYWGLICRRKYRDFGGKESCNLHYVMVNRHNYCNRSQQWTVQYHIFTLQIICVCIFVRDLKLVHPCLLCVVAVSVTKTSGFWCQVKLKPTVQCVICCREFESNAVFLYFHESFANWSRWQLPR